MENCNALFIVGGFESYDDENDTGEVLPVLSVAVVAVSVTIIDSSVFICTEERDRFERDVDASQRLSKASACHRILSRNRLAMASGVVS